MDWGKLMSRRELAVLNEFRVMIGPENSKVLYDLVGIAVAAEREECAKIADNGYSCDWSCDDVASAIRARGTQ